MRLIYLKARFKIRMHGRMVYERVRFFQEKQELMSTFIESKDQSSQKIVAFVNSVKKNWDRNPLSVSILRKKVFARGFSFGDRDYPCHDRLLKPEMTWRVLPSRKFAKSPARNGETRVKNKYLLQLPVFRAPPSRTVRTRRG